MKLEPGNWYWYVDCRKCNKPVPFRQDESKGKVALTAGPRDVAEVICPCGERGRYLLSAARSEDARALWLKRDPRTSIGPGAYPR